MSFIFHFIAKLFGRSAAPEAQPEVPSFILAFAQCQALFKAFEEVQGKSQSDEESC